MKTKIGTGVGLLLILTWCLLPVVWIISLSFKSQESITVGNPGFFPSAGTNAGSTTTRRCGTTSSSGRRSSTRSGSA